MPVHFSFRIAEIEEKFFNCVTVEEIAKALTYDSDLISFVYGYWKTKRKANFSNPLLAPKGTVNTSDSILW